MVICLNTPSGHQQCWRYVGGEKKSVDTENNSCVSQGAKINKIPFYFRRNGKVWGAQRVSLRNYLLPWWYLFLDQCHNLSFYRRGTRIGTMTSRCSGPLCKLAAAWSQVLGTGSGDQLSPLAPLQIYVGGELKGCDTNPNLYSLNTTNWSVQISRAQTNRSFVLSGTCFAGFIFIYPIIY